MADAGGIRAGRAYVELGVVDQALKAGLDAAAARLKSFGTRIAAVGASLSALGGLGLASLSAGLPKLVETSGQLLKMSQRTGVAVESLSELKFAAERSGTDLEGFESSLKKMQKFLTDAAGGSKEANKQLEDLGLSMNKLASMTPEDQFEAIAKAVSGVPHATERAGRAMAIFGKSGTMGLPMMQNMQALREEAKALGLALDEATVRSAAAFGGAMTRLKLQIGAVYTALAGALVPGLDSLVKMSQPVLSSVIAFVKTHAEWVRIAGATSAALIGLGTSLAVLGGVIRLAGVGFGTLSSVVITLLSPVRLLGGLLMTLGGAAVWQAASIGVGLFRVALLGLVSAFGLVRTVGVASVGAISTAWQAMMATVAFGKATFAGLGAAIGSATGIARIAILALALAARFAVIALVLQWTGGAGLMTAATLGLAAAVLTTKVGIMALGVAQVVMAKIVAGVQLAIAAFQLWTQAVIALIGFISTGQWLSAIISAIAVFGPLVAILWNIYGFMKLGEELASGWDKFKESATGAITSAGQAVMDFGTSAFARIRQAGAQAWEAIKVNAIAAWNSVRETGLQAWEAISVAVKRGDWQAAFAVGIGAIKLEWAKLRGFLEETWIEFKAWFVEQAGGIAIVASDAFASLEKAWVDTTTKLSIFWQTFINSLKPGFAVLESLWDVAKGGDFGQASQKISQAFVDAMNPEKFEEANNRDRAIREQRFEDIDKRRETRQKGIQAVMAETQAGKPGELADARARAKAAVEAAQQEFDKARGRAMPSWDEGSPNFIGPRLSDKAKEIPTAMEQAAAKAESIGTFTASIAGNIGAKSLDAQQLDALKAIEKNTKERPKPAVA